MQVSFFGETLDLSGHVAMQKSMQRAFELIEQNCSVTTSIDVGTDTIDVRTPLQEALETIAANVGGGGGPL